MLRSRRALLHCKAGSGRNVNRRQFCIDEWDGNTGALASLSKEALQCTAHIGVAAALVEQQEHQTIAAEQAGERVAHVATPAAPAKQPSPQVVKRVRVNGQMTVAAKPAAMQPFAFDCSTLEHAISSIIADNAARQAAEAEAARQKDLDQQAAAAEALLADAILEEFTIRPATAVLGGSSSSSWLAFTPVEGVPERRQRSVTKHRVAGSSNNSSLKTPHGRTPLEGVPEKFSMFNTPAARLYRYTFTPMEGLPERCEPFSSRTPAADMQQLPEVEVQQAAAAGSRAPAAAHVTPPQRSVAADAEAANAEEGAAQEQQHAHQFVDRLCKGLLQVSPQTPVPSHISGEGPSEQQQEQVEQEEELQEGGAREIMIQTGASLRNMSYLQSPPAGAGMTMHQQGKVTVYRAKEAQQRQQREQHVARPGTTAQAAVQAEVASGAGCSQEKATSGSSGARSAARPSTSRSPGAAKWQAAAGATTEGSLGSSGANAPANSKQQQQQQQQQVQQLSAGGAGAAAAPDYDDDGVGHDDDCGEGPSNWWHGASDEEEEEDQPNGQQQQQQEQQLLLSQQRQQSCSRRQQQQQQQQQQASDAEMDSDGENNAAAANRGGKRARASEVNMREKNNFKKRKSLAGEGTVTADDGVRRSRRSRYPPLEYWRNEKKTYNRKFQSLPTVNGIVTRTPVPMWPMTAGHHKGKTKRRRGRAASPEGSD